MNIVLALHQFFPHFSAGTEQLSLWVAGWLRDVAAPATEGVLLDFGCGGQPYRDLFTPRINRYVGADVAAAAGVSLDVTFGPGEPLSLSDASIDTILSTQVLEHVADPDFYLRDAEDC